MNLFAAALAEAAETAGQVTVQTTTTVQATNEQVGRLIFDLGFTAGTIAVLLLGWYILQAIADWKIFTKAGRAGWKSLIPFYNVYVEYDLCWNGLFGLVAIALPIVSSLITPSGDNAQWLSYVVMALGIVCLVVHFVQSVKLSKSFGKGTGFGILLFLFGPICRLVLGFGSSTYAGRQ